MAGVVGVVVGTVVGGIADEVVAITGDMGEPGGNEDTMPEGSVLLA